MHGCGDEWCYEPWNWMELRILLGLAYLGRAGGYAGSPYDPVGSACGSP